MRVVVWEIVGIECYLFDENIVRLDWLWSNLLGGGKLVVRERDAEESERLLGQNVAEKFDLEGAGQYEQPKCAKCGSMESSFEGLMKRVAGARLFLGLPIIGKMKRWNCNSCEHQWGIEDEDREEGPKPLCFDSQNDSCHGTPTRRNPILPSRRLRIAGQSGSCERDVLALYSDARTKNWYTRKMILYT